MRAWLAAVVAVAGCLSAAEAQPPAAAQPPPPILPPLAGLNPCPDDPYSIADCLPPCTTSGCPCGAPGEVWFGADFLMFWTSGSRLPPLVTAAPATSTNHGQLGRPDTRVLYGNQSVNNGLDPGFDVYAGCWLNDEHTWGLEGSFFDLLSTHPSFNSNSAGSGFALYRPFYNAATGTQASELATSIHVQDSMNLFGGDANLRRLLCCADECGYGYRVDLLAGYRFLSLQEALEIDEVVKTTYPPGTILLQDKFTTNNVFNGGQLGIDAEAARDGWLLGFRGLLALGVTAETVNVSGLTVLEPALGPGGALPGGLLALKTNMGHYSRDVFSAVPDVGVRVGRQITENLRVTVGYEFLYWSNVLRAPNQVDPVINPYYLPNPGAPIGNANPVRPAFEYHSSGLVIQGLTFGVEGRF